MRGITNCSRQQSVTHYGERDRISNIITVAPHPSRGSNPVKQHKCIDANSNKKDDATVWDRTLVSRLPFRPTTHIATLGALKKNIYKHIQLINAFVP